MDDYKRKYKKYKRLYYLNKNRTNNCLGGAEAESGEGDGSELAFPNIKFWFMNGKELTVDIVESGLSENSLMSSVLLKLQENNSINLFRWEFWPITAGERMVWAGISIANFFTQYNTNIIQLISKELSPGYDPNGKIPRKMLKWAKGARSTRTYLDGRNKSHSAKENVAHLVSLARREKRREDWLKWAKETGRRGNLHFDTARSHGNQMLLRQNMADKIPDSYNLRIDHPGVQPWRLHGFREDTRVTPEEGDTILDHQRDAKNTAERARTRTRWGTKAVYEYDRLHLLNNIDL